jgi:hypothetical protein
MDFENLAMIQKSERVHATEEVALTSEHLTSRALQS